MRRLNSLSVIVLAGLLVSCGGGDTTSPPATGSLQIVINGLSSGDLALVVVTGPGAFDDTVRTATTLSSLKPGTYTVNALPILTAGTVYTASNPTITVSVVASSAPATAICDYVPTSGSMLLVVTGLPAGVTPNITISGIGAVTPGLIGPLNEDQYYVGAHATAVGDTTYGGTPFSQLVVVHNGRTPLTVNVAYSKMSGQITLNVAAPPEGLTPNFTVSGPLGYTKTITTVGTTVLNGVPLGDYTIAGPQLESSTAIYAVPGPPTNQFTIESNSLTKTLNVAYGQTTSTITFVINGLPNGVPAAVTVSGHHLTQTTTLYKLSPNFEYDVTDSVVVSGGVNYLAKYNIFGTSCALNETPCTDTITYAALDFTIDAMYLIQSTQTYAGTVPLVKDRDGLLRIFVKANRDTRAEPVVRVRWYSFGALVRTDILNGPNSGNPVPQTINENDPNWSLPFPGSLIQPGLSILADIDPDNVAGEGDRTNNQFPAGGSPGALDVRSPSLFHVTLVPVRTAADGLTGSFVASDLLGLLQRMHPINGYVATTHAVYSTAESVPLDPNDANNEWFSILNQLSALRTAEGVSDSEYFYGVVHPNYSSGVAGLGWIGAPAAVGWDVFIPDKIAAHEIGHNWGRLHSPCGGPAGVDPNWPSDSKHANALIGAYGYDIATHSLLYPGSYYDIMSYCQMNQWTSDYTYTGIMDYRATSPSIAAAAAAAPEPTLLVWGRMRGNQLVLEPAFELVTRPRLPNDRGGNYVLEGLDARGSRLFSYAFDGEEVADLPKGGRGFAFAIPLSRFSVSELASLRLSGYGAAAERQGGPIVAASRVGIATTTGARAAFGTRGRVRVTWDATSFPMAMIRDASTGQVLSFARGGTGDVVARGGALEITVSDGVRSVAERVQPK